MRPSAGAAASASSARGAKAGSGSGAAAAKSSGAARKSGAAGRTRDLPQLSDFVDKCDWTGALALLDFNRRSGEGGADTLAWIAYSAFHLGDFARALDTFEQLETSGDASPEVALGKACCLYNLRRYSEAVHVARDAADCALKTRLLFHCAHKLSDEELLMTSHDKISDGKVDQLSLAAIHFFRSHFQDATDIYKRLSFEFRDDLALNMYMATSYYKLDYYDVSLQILNVYLQHFPASIAAINLKACNHFRLYSDDDDDDDDSGKAAETELRTLTEATGDATIVEHSNMLKHNLVVFRGGDGAPRVLTPLLDAVPEARLNLIVYHLKHGEINEAHALVKDMEPAVPVEYIVKAIVFAELGQSSGSREHLRLAQQYFQLVGASPSECDTVPGRQCMASCFFLLRQFKDVNVYLSSIKPYVFNDSDFNWNFGIAQAAVGNYREAEEALLLVTDERYTADYVFISWLARCYIMNGKAKMAWDLYLRMDNSHDSFNLLQLIANDCYRVGAFFYAAKAFHVLERYDPEPEYWEGKRGACIGVLQQVIAEEEPRESLRDVLEMLQIGSNPQQKHVASVISKWCTAHGVRAF